MKMVDIFMMSSKLPTLDLLKIKVFWNKGYEVISFVHDVTKRFVSRDWNYIVDVVMWSKLVNSSLHERGCHNLNYIRIWLEKPNVFRGALRSRPIT